MAAPTNVYKEPRFNRYLLFCTAGEWLSYLVSKVPVPTGAELARGALLGFFGLALMWSTITAALALYGAARYRYLGHLIPAALAIPLAALCWWQFAHWPVIGDG